MSESDPFLWVGATIDSKVLVEAIAGEGGFGVVYRALHLGFQEPVAVKCLKLPPGLTAARRDAFLSGFMTEARVLRRLCRATPNVVEALDVGASAAPNGAWTPYIVMEWLDGESLEGHLARRQNARTPSYALDEAVAFLTPAAEALGVAHELQIAHRDIKPANLFLTQIGKKLSVKVVDFGIAKVLADNVISVEGMVTGGEDILAFSPQYGAPEQFDPKLGGTGPWTDVYAFALVLLEVTSGRPALQGTSYFQHMISSLNSEQRPTFRGWGVAASPESEEVLTRALALRPRDRFASVTEMWMALSRSIRGGAGGSASREPSPFTLRRHGLVPIPGTGGSAGGGRAAEIGEPGGPSRSDGLAGHGRHGGHGAGSPSGSGSMPRVVPETSPSLSGPAGENRLCTILVVDLGELAALADELEATELHELLDWCREQLGLCAEELGGAVDRLTSDSLTAVFGAPRSHENDAERATLAALRMRDVMEHIVEGDLRLASRGVSTRMGLHTGSVFVGVNVGVAHEDASVVGEAVTLATRLQQSAAPGEIVISRETLRHVEGSFNVEPLPVLEGRGKTKSLQVFRVDGPTSLRVPILRSDFYGLPTKLLGRDIELELIDAQLAALHERTVVRGVTMLGLPGIGRTRMLGEIFLRLQRDPRAFFVMAARASQLADQSPFSFISSMLRMRFGVQESDSIESTSQKILSGLRVWTKQAGQLPAALPSGPQILVNAVRGTTEAASSQSPSTPRDATAHLLSDVTVLATMLAARGESFVRERTLSADEAPSLSKGRMSAALARVLEHVGVSSPAVLLCDDAHWADDASLDLLEDVAQRLQDTPFFLVTTARPELLERRPAWGIKLGEHASIELKKLSDSSLAEMVDDRLRLAAEPPSRDFVEFLVGRASGIPLVLTETLQLLVDAGAIERHADQPWLVHEERARTISLPNTVRGIIQSRLDQLDPDERALLTLASVVGDTFWEGSLIALASSAQLRSMTVVAEPTLAAAVLARLRDRRLIRAREPSTIAGEREYSFVETSMREVAYETLSVKVRRIHHRYAAEWLSPRLRGDATAALVARHFDLAGRPDAAVVDYARAAAHASSFGRNLEALRLYERAAEILADSRTPHDRKPGVSQTAIPGDSTSRRIASWQLRTRLLLESGDVLRRLGRLDDAEARYVEARVNILTTERRHDVERAAQEGHLWHARALMRLAHTYKVRGELARARSLAEEALSVATRAQALSERTAILTALAGIHRREGNLDACREAALRGLRLCRAVLVRDDAWRDAVANLLIALGAVFYSKKELVRAERCYRQAARLVVESTHPRTASFALNDIAVTRYTSGDFSTALTMFLRSLALKEREGDLYQVAIAHNNVAEVNLHLGNGADALVHATRAVKLAELVGAGADLSDMLRNYAEARLATGDAHIALESALRAFTDARTNASVYLPDVTSTLATVLATICKSALLGHARERLEEALSSLEDFLLEKPDLGRSDEGIRASLDTARGTLRTRP